MSKRNTIIGGVIVVVVAALSVVLGVDLLERFGLAEAGSPGPILPDSGTTERAADFYEIYFTDPACPPTDERTGGVDEIIADDIRLATRQVDVAAFELESEVITQALIEAANADIVVRVVTDEDYGEAPDVRRLRRNGISVVEDKRRGLMHNKFIVIDGRVLWTGSLNFTSNGVYCNNNNLVRLESPRLANNYIVEMNEMYLDRAFGPESPANTPGEQLTIGGIDVENYFAPEKELAPIIARTVARAEDEILFMAFSFTNTQIGEAILGRGDAGVSVRGVFETSGADTGFSYFPIMQAARRANVQVRTDGNSRIMHHKVIIVDRQSVILGSFNFSDSANRRNDENLLIVHDPTFAAFFVDEFEAVWAEAGS